LPSSYLQTNKLVLPKPPEKPQVRENVIFHPSPSSRPNSPLPSSSAETSKMVLPKPPDKPPRVAAAVRADPVSPAHHDSYGLLVYAAGAAAPSVHVEKVDSDVRDAPQQKVSSKLVGDMRSRLESQRGGSPTHSEPEAVLNSSRLQNSNAVRSNVASRPPVSDAWDNKFIRAPKKTVRRKGGKENFVSKGRMNNPSYMYVSVYTDDVISSQQKIVTDKQPLTRHHSDDMLNMPPAPSLQTPRSPGYKEPLYAVPYDATNNAHQVVFDFAGYAMPNTPDSTQFKVICCCCIAFTLQNIFVLECKFVCITNGYQT